MKSSAPPPRRSFLRSALALGGMAVVPMAWAAPRRNTPSQVLGPFYPVEKPLDQDADLTMIDGKSGRAQGKVVHLMGRVLNRQGQPIPGARIEIWQANTHGRYSHPADSNSAPIDPSFEGFAVQTSDALGRFRFKTIKPGPYPVTPDWTRPPHIHFDVTGHGGRIVTQMYFQGEPLNEMDRFLNSTKRKQELIAHFQSPADDMEPDSLVAVWDITLPEG